MARKKTVDELTKDVLAAEEKPAKTNEKEEPVTQERIEIKPHVVDKFRIRIVGDTPLMVNRWSEKKKREMLERMQMTKAEKVAAKNNRERRDPFADFVEAAYWITPEPKVRGLSPDEQQAIFEKAIDDGAKFGFPVISFKKAAVEACYQSGVIKNRPIMRRMIHVHAVNHAHVGSSQELAILDIEDAPEMSEDPVTVSNGEPDLRYRPVFRKWSVDLDIQLIDCGYFTRNDIVNAFDRGGFMNGVGEWRTEKDGEFGNFHVELVEG